MSAVSRLITSKFFAPGGYFHKVGLRERLEPGAPNFGANMNDEDYGYERRRQRRIDTEPDGDDYEERKIRDDERRNSERDEQLLRARTNELEEAQKHEMKLQERIFADLVVKFAEYQSVDGPAALPFG